MPRKAAKKSIRYSRNSEPFEDGLPSNSSRPIKKIPKFHLHAKNEAQKDFIETVRSSDLTFALGSAGSGKTFLAVALAVEALTSKQVDKIILIRPAVEAGECLGYLPGDLQEKVDPYMRPIYDALYMMIGKEQTEAFIKSDTIEIATLAFLRGRTLSKCFVIIDEAQNTTQEQMKMALTRFGEGFQAVITGDLSQTDLKPHVLSGLKQAIQKLDKIKGISIFEFSDDDIVRHPLVQDIVRAYQD